MSDLDGSRSDWRVLMDADAQARFGQQKKTGSRWLFWGLLALVAAPRAIWTALRLYTRGRIDSVWMKLQTQKSFASRVKGLAVYLKNYTKAKFRRSK